MCVYLKVLSFIASYKYLWEKKWTIMPISLMCCGSMCRNFLYRNDLQVSKYCWLFSSFFASNINTIFSVPEYRRKWGHPRSLHNVWEPRSLQHSKNRKKKKGKEKEWLLCWTLWILYYVSFPHQCKEASNLLLLEMRRTKSEEWLTLPIVMHVRVRTGRRVSMT